MSLEGDEEQALAVPLSSSLSPGKTQSHPHDLPEALQGIKSEMGAEGLGLTENSLLLCTDPSGQAHTRICWVKIPAAFPGMGNSERKMQQGSEEKRQGHKQVRKEAALGGKLQMIWSRGKKPRVGWGSRAGTGPGCCQKGDLVPFSKKTQ